MTLKGLERVLRVGIVRAVLRLRMLMRAKRRMMADGVEVERVIVYNCRACCIAIVMLEAAQYVKCNGPALQKQKRKSMIVGSKKVVQGRKSNQAKERGREITMAFAGAVIRYGCS